MTDYLLDTCTVIWAAHNDPLREPAASELRVLTEDPALDSRRVVLGLSGR